MSRCVVVTNKTIAPQNALRGDKVVLILKITCYFLKISKSFVLIAPSAIC